MGDDHGGVPGLCPVLPVQGVEYLWLRVLHRVGGWEDLGHTGLSADAAVPARGDPAASHGLSAERDLVGHGGRRGSGGDGDGVVFLR